MTAGYNHYPAAAASFPMESPPMVAMPTYSMQYTAVPPILSNICNIFIHNNQCIRMCMLNLQLCCDITIHCRLVHQFTLHCHHHRQCNNTRMLLQLQQLLNQPIHFILLILIHNSIIESKLITLAVRMISQVSFDNIRPTMKKKKSGWI